MTTITLPPLPKKSTLYYKEGLKHGEASHAYGYTADQLRARDLEVARLVLKGAAKQVRDSGVCPFAIADGIAATEVKHHE